MAVFRVDKTRDYTVMSNHHLKNRTLSLKAKGLLSVMLSLPEDWDYTLKGLSTICRENIDAIREGVKELERSGYIVRSRTRNDKGQLKGAEYVIYEKPQEVSLPTSYCPTLEDPTLENPILDNPMQEKPMVGLPMQDNPTLLNTYPVTTQKENTQLLNPYPSNPQQVTQGDEIGLEDIAQIRELVLENIGYEQIKTTANADRLDELVDIMVETICSKKQTVCVAGGEYPTALVKEKFLRIDSEHIQYIFYCMDNTTTYIRNIRKYLLTSLFNAPSTIGSYYTALVNHDMKGDGSRGHKSSGVSHY